MKKQSSAQASSSSKSGAKNVLLLAGPIEARTSWWRSVA
jgi:hypothetical protein